MPHHNPECPECKQPMEEYFGVITDDRNDESYDVMIGYECKKCELKYTTDGEEVG